MSWRAAALACLLFGFGSVSAQQLPPGQSAPDAAPELPVAPPGFKVELVRTAQVNEGSWICMAFDDKGRLIISPQEGYLLQFTLTNGQVTGVETIQQPVGAAMGLLYAFDSLYTDSKGPSGYGLYKLPRDPATGQYQTPQPLGVWGGNSSDEHGAHAIVLGPDNHLYVVCGNFVQIPNFPGSPYHGAAMDQLLPEDEDSGGFGVGLHPPEGFVLRMGPNAEEPAIFCGGLRNIYDIAFNSDGELFGWDNDQEHDWGMPWYRPCCIFHLISGGEYGYREGTAKWPQYYPDCLPPTLSVGLACPTSLMFGDRTHFPYKYKKALYAGDWTYGRIFAVHLTPKGSSYTAQYETFISGKPLNITAMDIGPDGAMYFVTGGRHIQSSLYRVTYTGPMENSVPAPTAEESNAAKARQLRHSLEKFDAKEDPVAIAAAWPSLDSNDVFLRFAARTAIEGQPVDQWSARALAETNKTASLAALLSLARYGGKETQPALLDKLDAWKWESLTEPEQLDKMRVLELSFIRQGKPSPETARRFMEELDKEYPASTNSLNPELCQLLVYLQAPDVVAKTMALVNTAQSQEQQIRYLFILRTVRDGWTIEQRKQYFTWLDMLQPGAAGDAEAFQGGLKYYPISKRAGIHPQPATQTLQWFADAGREYADGCSFPGFISNFRNEAISTLSPAEHAALDPWLASHAAAAQAPAQTFKQGPFVKNWKMADLQPLLATGLGANRSINRGREVFFQAGCVQCHRFGSVGGAVGPDLTALGRRYSPRDILESILEPSKVIANQYRNTIIVTAADQYTGRLVAETPDDVTLMTDLLAHITVNIPKKDIVKRKLSDISPMPEGLLDHFTSDDALNLIAFLESGSQVSALGQNKK